MPPTQNLKTGYNKGDNTWRCACSTYHKGVLTIVPQRTWYRHNPNLLRKRRPRTRQDADTMTPVQEQNGVGEMERDLEEGEGLEYQEVSCRCRP